MRNLSHLGLNTRTKGSQRGVFSFAWHSLARNLQDQACMNCVVSNAKGRKHASDSSITEYCRYSFFAFLVEG